MSNSFFYLHAKKSLGQNFLKDEFVIQDIVDETKSFLSEKNISSKNLLEIGPGTGVLTKALLEENFTVTAIEKDTRAIAGLQSTLAQEYPEKLVIHEEDILNFSPQPFAFCIGNIPYYITSDILMWLCAHKTKFSGAMFMVQDEVADRLCAHENTKEYSRLTIKMQLNFEIRKLFKVPKECFVPSPKVDSAVVLFIPNTFAFSNAEDEKEFEKFTGMLFSNRRKMLRRIFAGNTKLQTEEDTNSFWTKVSTLKIAPTDRPESISPQKMLKFFRLYLEI